MADNLTLNAGSGGGTLATASLSFSGDTAQVQIVGCGILSGSEGSWTLSQFVGGAGAVAAGVQRVTLASDDPAVVDLAAIETLITAGNVDLAALEVLVTAGNVDLAAIEVLLTAIDADTSRIPALGQAAMAASAPVVIASDQSTIPVSLASVPSHAVTNAGTFAVQAAQSGTWNVGTVTTVTTCGTVTNVAQLGGQAVSMGTGVRDAGTQRVTIATDDAVPVTGTFWQATQPVSGTFWQATQPVSAASLPLPSGAATSALQGGGLPAALGSGGGLKVDGSGTALPVSGTVTVGSITAGDNNIGNVDVATIAAGTNTIGGTISQHSSSVLYDGTTACTIKRASGVAAGGAPGTDSILTAVVGKKFRILALFLKATSATANNVYLSTATDTDVLGNSGNPIPLAVDADGDNDSGFVLPYNQGGWTETSTANEALILNTSAAQDIIWVITYIEVA